MSSTQGKNGHCSELLAFNPSTHSYFGNQNAVVMLGKGIERDFSAY